MKDSLRMVEVTIALNTLIREMGSMRWYCGLSQEHVSGVKLQSERLEERVKEYVNTGRRLHTIGIGQNVLTTCLRCEFGEFPYSTDKFWSALWDYLAPIADVPKIKESLMKLDPKECGGFQGTAFLKLIAEHLLPVASVQ